MRRCDTEYEAVPDVAFRATDGSPIGRPSCSYVTLAMAEWANYGVTLAEGVNERSTPWDVARTFRELHQTGRMLTMLAKIRQVADSEPRY